MTRRFVASGYTSYGPVIIIITLSMMVDKIKSLYEKENK